MRSKDHGVGGGGEARIPARCLELVVEIVYQLFCDIVNVCVHVVDDVYLQWEMYAMGGSGNLTLKSQGAWCTAPTNSNAKEVSTRLEMVDGFGLIMSLQNGRVLKDLILHHSSTNNSATLSVKFGRFYFIFKFGISGLLHHVVTAIATEYEVELLEYMDVHDYDASETSQPSWGKIVYIGEVVYSTSLNMVRVKYSANVRRIVADFSNAPSNGYSPRHIDK
ncbi:hypothetical protein Tco_0482439 [Tanacetum coccineum]